MKTRDFKSIGINTYTKAGGLPVTPELASRLPRARSRRAKGHTLLLFSMPEDTTQLMSLSETIQKDMVTAMKARDELRLSVLRMIKAAIQLKETEKIRKLEDTEFIQLLQTLVKQRKESIEQFTKGNRPELAEKESKELAIIESYLPAGATDAEMDAAIARAIAETGASSMKQMGAVVKAAKAALEGKTVDGKVLSDRVRDRLSKMA
jgi:uncharacterized protein YqeY